MKHTYKITGMTCESCKESVEKNLNELRNIQSVEIDLNKGEAVISMNKHIDTKELQKALPSSYKIYEKQVKNVFASATVPQMDQAQSISKVRQLKPLLLVFFYIATASVLLHYNNWKWHGVMLDFMGLFYVVFGFFKLLDLKGFQVSFKMYDPLAKHVPVYGLVYPFIETVLGVMFLMRLEVNIALVATLVVLGATTLGVVKTLLKKQSVQCACLGSVLKLPMTEATVIENVIMITMALLMLLY